MLKLAIPGIAILPDTSLIKVPGAPGVTPKEKVAILISSSFALHCAGEVDPAVVPAGQCLGVYRLVLPYFFTS